MTVDEIRLALSREARATLINFGGSHSGYLLPRGTSGAIQDELLQYGLIGRNAGLTVRGAMVRTVVLDKALDAL